MKWTDALIARLKKYVEGSRWFRVEYQGHKVRGIDERQPQYGDTGWPAFFLDKGKNDPLHIEEEQPSDFKVIAQVPLHDWMNKEPYNPQPHDGYETEETVRYSLQAQGSDLYLIFVSQPGLEPREVGFYNWRQDKILVREVVPLNDLLEKIWPLCRELQMKLLEDV